MTHLVDKLGWFGRVTAHLESRRSYAAFIRGQLGRDASARPDVSTASAEEELNRLMSGYPHNHEYRIVGKRLAPSFKLYERLRLVEKAYPKPLKSFLDIGCCRGFYVLDSATRSGCPRAVGIDVCKPFVATARNAAQYLGADSASFYDASLEQVSTDPTKYGGPFQTVLLIGTYHYLYWGSGLCSTAYYSHDEILRQLASVCTDRLIFSARITKSRLRRLPEGFKERLDETKSSVYTPDAFLRSAEKYFRVSHTGYLGLDPLLVMTRA